MSPEIWIAGVLGIAATVEDLAARRISNWIPLAALVAGVAYHAATNGFYGVASALGGAAGGFVAFILIYILRAMGGGDVKLMGGFGAVLGVGRLFEGVLFTALIGGLIALGVVGWRAVARIWNKNADRTVQPDSIPYAPAIALGALLALLSK